MPNDICSVEGCDRVVVARGYCKRCYYRMRDQGVIAVLPPRDTLGLPQRHGEDALKHTWRKMLNRCENPRDKRFDRYGARGITVCADWHEYVPFRDWAIGAGYDSIRSIDRIDNDGPYSPENCRWATASEQRRNTSTSRALTAFGEMKTVPDWTEDPRCAVTYAALIQRLDRGWVGERALTEPTVVTSSERTHCPQGHAYTDNNTYVTGAGHRRCATCRKQAARERHARRRES